MARLMRVLVVNAGSSTLKLRVVEGGEVAAGRDVDPWDGETAAADLADLAAAAGPPDVVAHRVVHGGPRHRATAVDDDLVSELEALTPLAPLHQPRAVAAIGAARRAFPALPHVACFDTAFHADLPEAAATYALPAEWRARWPLRRAGFHGLSHDWAARRAAALTGRGPEGLRVVTCHLGSGASLAAVRDGRSIDTTMGLTPLEGLVMSHRSGSVDPGLVLWLLREVGLSPSEVEDGLTGRSGLAGLAGGSGDVRDVLAGVAAGRAAPALALAVYVHRLRQGIAAMAASLGGLDALVFTGGVGEHQPAVRKAACEGLAFLGVRLDAAANRAAGGGADRDIADPAATVRVLVVAAREELVMAELVAAVAVPGAPGSGETGTQRDHAAAPRGDGRKE